MLLNLAYLVALLLLSPVLAYGAMRKGKYRYGWSQKLLGNVPALHNKPAGTDGSHSGTNVSPQSSSKRTKRLWMHAVSVGEVNLASGLLDGILSAAEASDLSIDCVITTTTVTGFDLAKKRFPEHTVCYCPFDFTWSMRRAFDRFRPDLIVLIELEIWPNWVRLAKQRNIPLAVVNGRLSEKSFRGYHRLRWLLSPTFARLLLVAAQDDTYAYRFRTMGVAEDKVHVTGSLKFDDAPLCRDVPQVHQYRMISGATSDHVVWVAGSTQAGEETIVLSVYQSLRSVHKNLRLIIVPRHADRFDEVAGEIAKSGFKCRRRTSLKSEHAAQTPMDTANHANLDWESDTVLLVDTIGELRGWWGLADVAFVGGSLGSRGGQNMLEPAGYGAAVCFGPNTRNFRDIVMELLGANAAKVVGNESSLRDFIEAMIQNPDAATAMGRAAQQVITKHQGARKRTTELLINLLTRSTSPK